MTVVKMEVEIVNYTDRVIVVYRGTDVSKVKVHLIFRYVPF